MFRKLILALSATAVIGAAALTPSTASAKWWGHGHFHKHWHGGGFYPAYYGGYGYGGCFYVKKFVPTPYGMIKKNILVCN